MPARTVSVWKHLRMSLKVTNELTYSRGSLVLFFTHWGCLDLEQPIKMICTSNTLLLLKEMKAKAKKKTKKTKAYTVQLETWQNVCICFEVLQKKMYLRVCVLYVCFYQLSLALLKHARDEMDQSQIRRTASRAETTRPACVSARYRFLFVRNYWRLLRSRDAEHGGNK